MKRSVNFRGSRATQGAKSLSLAEMKKWVDGDVCYFCKKPPYGTSAFVSYMDRLGEHQAHEECAEINEKRQQFDLNGSFLIEGR